MLIYSMTVSVDGFVTDRDGGIEWTVPDDEVFRAHTDEFTGLVTRRAGCVARGVVRRRAAP